MDELITIRGEIVRETDKAFLFKTGGGEKWIPKSQIAGNVTFLTEHAGDKPVTIAIPKWLAKTKDIR